MKLVISFIALAIALFCLNLKEANAQSYTSASHCSAYTDCYDAYGRFVTRVSCVVYGYQHLQNAGVNAANNSCSWFVQPYVGVDCRGYQQVLNPYTGQYAWTWQTYNFRCPGY